MFVKIIKQVSNSIIVLYLLLVQFGPWIPVSGFKNLRIDQLLIPVMTIFVFLNVNLLKGKYSIFKFYFAFSLSVFISTLIFLKEPYVISLLSLLNNISAMFSPVIIIIFFAYISDGKKTLEKCLKTIVYSSVLVYMYGILQYLKSPFANWLNKFMMGGASSLENNIILRAIANDRITSIFINPGGPLGIYCSWMVLILIMYGYKKLNKIHIHILLILTFITGYMGKSKTFYGGVGVILFYLLIKTIFGQRNMRIKYPQFEKVIFSIASLLIFLSFEFFIQDYSASSQTAVEFTSREYIHGRTIGIFSEYIDVFFKSPLIGNGYQVMIRDNLYGPILAAGGIVGVILLLLFSVDMINFLNKCNKNLTENTFLVSFTCFLFLLSGMTTPSFYVAKLSNIFSVFLGCFIADYIYQQKMQRLNREY